MISICSLLPCVLEYIYIYTLIHELNDQPDTCSFTFRFTDKMKLVANLLNLKPHHVWNRSRTSRTLLYSPLDLEGHLGRDGRYYVTYIFYYPDFHFLQVLDCSRLFPAVSPFRGIKSSHLYNLMRPEFVNQFVPVKPSVASNFRNRYQKPLSSDAFAKFAVDDESPIHNQEV